MAGSNETNEVGVVAISCRLAVSPDAVSADVFDGLDQDVPTAEQLAQLDEGAITPLGQVLEHLRPVRHRLGDQPIGLAAGLEPRPLTLVPRLAPGAWRPSRRPRG